MQRLIILVFIFWVGIAVYKSHRLLIFQVFWLYWIRCISKWSNRASWRHLSFYHFWFWSFMLFLSWVILKLSWFKSEVFYLHIIKIVTVNTCLLRSGLVKKCFWFDAIKHVISFLGIIKWTDWISFLQFFIFIIFTFIFIIKVIIEWCILNWLHVRWF